MSFPLFLFRIPNVYFGLNLLNPLTLSPYLKNAIGTGIKITAKKPNKLIAQSTPNFLNIADANIGNPAAASALTNVLAAIALLACHLYTSMM